MRRSLSVLITSVLVILLAGCNLDSAAPSPTITDELIPDTAVPPDGDLPTESAPTEDITLVIPEQIELTPLQTSAATDAPNTMTPDTIEDAPTPIVTAAVPESEFPQHYPNTYDQEVRAGQTLIVAYDVVINNPGRGRVFIIVRNPTGDIIGRLAVLETAQAELEVTTSMSGIHQIGVAIQNLSGNYNLSFSLR